MKNTLGDGAMDAETQTEMELYDPSFGGDSWFSMADDPLPGQTGYIPDDEFTGFGPVVHSAIRRGKLIII